MKSSPIRLSSSDDVDELGAGSERTADGNQRTDNGFKQELVTRLLLRTSVFVKGP